MNLRDRDLTTRAEEAGHKKGIEKGREMEKIAAEKKITVTA